MSSKPQFTQGMRDLPLCSLKTAVLALGVGNAALFLAAMLGTSAWGDVYSSFLRNTLWFSPAVLTALPLMCYMQGKQALKHWQMMGGPAAIAVIWALAFQTIRLGSIGAVFLTNDSLPVIFRAWLFMVAMVWVFLCSQRPVAAPLPELEEADLRHLGSEIRPHFFFNALNAVMGLIRVNPKQAEAVLQDTAELFRSVMQQHDQRLVTLATELDTCQQYARIEQARLAHRLVLAWQIDEALLAVNVPPFSLQPLIENAIRHGIEPLAKGGKVSISVYRQDHNLLMRVSNPVLSELERYRATQAKQHNGVALDNISKRLALMYAQAAQFDHGIVEGRYEALISLPLEFEPT
jgi:two-component system, LytTR family, sensor histidine kinase AlgZ